MKRLLLKQTHLPTCHTVNNPILCYILTVSSIWATGNPSWVSITPINLQ